MDHLRILSHRIRCDVVRMLAAAGSGHLGGSLSSADIFATLYGGVLQVDPQRPGWPERDRFICSIGHVAPAYYAALAHAGFFPVESLRTLRQLGSPLQGHPSVAHGLPGVDAATGSLGQGLSLGVGFALAARKLQQSWRSYVLLGDGELQEGQVWEAAMAAAHHQLAALTAIVDRNGLQIDGPTVRTMNIEPLVDKWLAFGWDVLAVDGHSVRELLEALTLARKTPKPTVILATTHMGRGVPEIEGQHGWHGKSPSAEEEARFLEALQAYYRGQSVNEQTES